MPTGSEQPEVSLRSIELLRVSVPLVDAHRSAHATEHSRESVLVRVVDGSGWVGIGECPTLAGPGYVTETTDEAWRILASELAPAWLTGSRMPAPGAPAASASIADAVLDCWLRGRGEALAEWLNPPPLRPRRSLRWCAVLASVGAGPVELGVATLVAARQGAAMVKVKFTDPDRLGATVAALREVSDIPVAADANGSLDEDGCAAVDPLGLAYLEQPLPAGTPWETLAGLRRTMVTPLCLDESLSSADALADSVRSAALDVASIKPARMGGVVAAAAAARHCAALGVDCFVGGMFELGIGRAGALAVASMPACTVATDLGPSERYVRTDVCAAHVLDGSGSMAVPAGVGIGRELDDRATARFLTDRLLVSA